MSHPGRGGWAAATLACLVLLAPFCVFAQQAEFSDEAVEQAIQRGKKYLWSQYNANDGHWPEPGPDAQGVPNINYGGYSSLPIYALLASGEGYQDPRMKKALEWLSKLDCKGTYTLGLRCQIWAMLPKELGHELLKKDVERLIKSICQPPKGAPPSNLVAQASYGSYTYVSSGTPGPGGDHSNTQYGILGVWAGARGNLEIPKWYWDLIFRHWVITQNNDGGWGYGHFDGSTGTMTAAGLASMYVAFDNLFVDQFTKCGANPDIPTIKKALDWYDRNFAGLAMGGYLLYGVERVGLASGQKYFGKQDWYKIGATRVVAGQQGDGGWGSPVETSFMLLFLVRGRAPVLFNRLEYKGDWNNRPRGVANLMHWMSRTFEREVNWQIINLQSDVQEWHDAPILLVTGAKKPAFAPPDLEKLRAFVWQGGVLLSIAECQGTAFDAGMRETYKNLFPDYELKVLPPDHAVFSAHFPLKTAIKLWGLSNGIRLLALHCVEDLPMPWQTNMYQTQADAFRLAANIAFFATDRASLRSRGTSLWPKDKPFTPTRQAKVARVKYAGNWNPEPLAWERFRRLMGQKWQTKLEVGEAVTLGQLKVGEYRVAHVTGTGELNLTPEEKQALKAYVESGGMVILDSAGGSDAFSDSAARVIGDLFGPDALGRLPSLSPLYRQQGMEIPSVRYRRAARDRIGDVKVSRLMGAEVNGRLAVLLSKEDLTAGLVGYPCYTCIGYDPESAAELMRNAIFYGLRVEPASAPAGPAPAGG